MKTTSINYLKLIFTDRLLAVLLIVLIFASLAYCVFVGTSLHPSDLQVAVHYSAFGETTFYRDKWFYFINFIAFGFLIGAMHSILAIKLYAQGRRQMALLFAWLSLFLIVIVWATTAAILKVAFL